MQNNMIVNDQNLGLMRKSFPNLDVVRFVCALLIIEIHAPIFGQSHEVVNFYLTHVIARIGVPLFFSISGFLFFGRLEWENGKIRKSEDNIRHLLHYLKQNGKIYILWTVIYVVFSLPKWYRIGWLGMAAVKDTVVAFFFRGFYYHMWYLLASIYAVPILYFLMRHLRRSYVAMLAAALWICQCLTYSYTWIDYWRMPIATLIFSKISILGATLFCAVPLLTVGAFCGSQKPLKFPEWQKWWALLSFVLCALEASLLYFFSPNEGKYSYLFCTPIFTYTALRLLTMGKQCAITERKQKVLRTMSLGMYCMHPLLIDCLKALNMTNSVMLWATVTAASFILALLWSEIKLRKR